MSAIRFGWSLAVLFCALMVWQLLKPNTGVSANARATPPSSAVNVTAANAAGEVGGKTKMDLSAEPVLKSPSKVEARAPLSAAVRIGLQSSNYRQYIHQVLAQPSAVGIRVGLELSTACSVIQQLKRPAEAPKLRLARDLEAELQRRTKACEQSNGPDWQQLKALSAAKKRSFDEADEFLTFRVLKGTQDELAALYRLGDASGMSNWGLASTPEHLALLVGDEKAFLQHPSLAPVHAAWQAAICERFSCDDFNARIVRCRDDASCQMSLQDILKESAGVDDATWLQLLAAARRRRDALLPG